MYAYTPLRCLPIGLSSQILYSLLDFDACYAICISRLLGALC
jgi:hypothetical protein